MTINVDESAVKRISALRLERAAPKLMLRVTVDGGGCSGFQYNISLTEEHIDSDIIFGDCVLTDSVSLDFLQNATVRFESTLLGSDFKIDNPNAVSGCGCGVSFAV